MRMNLRPKSIHFIWCSEHLGLTCQFNSTSTCNTTLILSSIRDHQNESVSRRQEDGVRQWTGSLPGWATHSCPISTHAWLPHCLHCFCLYIRMPILPLHCFAFVDRYPFCLLHVYKPSLNWPCQSTSLSGNWQQFEYFHTWLGPFTTDFTTSQCK